MTDFKSVILMEKGM